VLVVSSTAARACVVGPLLVLRAAVLGPKGQTQPLCVAAAVHAQRVLVAVLQLGRATLATCLHAGRLLLLLLVALRA
jgi:hypothetical protein